MSEQIGYTGKAVDYVVATTGTYDITAFGGAGGASGSGPGGAGAEIEGQVQLHAGDVLEVIAGGVGANGVAHNTSFGYGITGAAGGGGGTWIYDLTTKTLLEVAGGGGGEGGSYGRSSHDGQPGSVTAPGTGIGGGAGAGGYGGGAGGGFLTAGGTAPGSGYGGGGFPALDGGASGTYGGAGAFGGGGGGGGGAYFGGGGGGGGFTGGYAGYGGGVGYSNGGGGGSSYDAGLTLNAAAGENAGAGFVDIKLLCFVAGTLIAVPDGQRAVESLRIGDFVLTAEGDLASVKWIGRRTLEAEGDDSYRFLDPLKVMPVRICAGALGDGLPERDLLLSADHALLLDGVLVQAGALVNGVSIKRELTFTGNIEYYHVELESHALIVAEGVLAETFVDNVDRMGFDNWSEHELLYPNAQPIEEMEYPRAKAVRQLPWATLARVAQRAREFSFVPA